MLHKPAGQSGPDYAQAYKTKLGLLMFAIYTAMYAGFVIINITKAVIMEKIIIFGLNLATVYGFGLIIVALLLALVYNHLCTKKEDALSSAANEKGGE